MSLSESHSLNIEVVATGNELLDGSILDRHTQSLGIALAPFGVQVGRTQIVRDHDEQISAALVEAGLGARVVVVTGGLGPTRDDRTLEVAAKCFGSHLVKDKSAKKNVLDRLRKVGRKRLNPGHYKMMLIPLGSKVLKNKEGAAPAVQWDIGDRTYFFLPGVPSEFRFVLNNFLVPWFKKRRTTQGQYRFVYKTFGWPESELNGILESLKIPDGVETGYRTTLPENHVKLLVDAVSEKSARLKVHKLDAQLKKKLGNRLFSTDESSFEGVVVNHLTQKRRKICLAESCTAGMAASLICRVSGASKVLDRSYVVYSNEAKQDLLGVRKETLSKFGAVSKETAEEMARGALLHSGADLAVSITGIAGPNGGTKGKPVGLVWFGLARRKKAPKGKRTSRAAQSSVTIHSEHLQLGFDRELNQKYSAYHALWLLLQGSN